MSKGDGKTITIDGKSSSGRGSLFWSGVSTSYLSSGTQGGGIVPEETLEATVVL